MLMGLYPNFDAYAQYNNFLQSNPSRDDGYLTDNIRNLMVNAGFTFNGENVVNPLNYGSLSVNPFLMTYKDIATGDGFKVVHVTGGTLFDIAIKDIFDNVVGYNTHFVAHGEKDYIMIENMVPEGRRMKAGTISMGLNNGVGNVKIYGLGTTMPDPTQMGAIHPALTDGIYRYAWSLHRPATEGAYRAFRLFSQVPNTWEQVSGSRGSSPIGNFPYRTTNNWGNPAYRENYPAYYYDANGNRMNTTTDQINGHKSYRDPFILRSNNYTAGSEGCLVWVPAVFTPLTTGLETSIDSSGASRISWGNFIINRSFFGDGTNGRNNWWAP
jgi:hypothetical protein